jgi:hypothetical protein
MVDFMCNFINPGNGSFQNPYFGAKWLKQTLSILNYF